MNVATGAGDVPLSKDRGSKDNDEPKSHHPDLETI